MPMWDRDREHWFSPGNFCNPRLQVVRKPSGTGQGGPGRAPVTALDQPLDRSGCRNPDGATPPLRTATYGALCREGMVQRQSVPSKVATRPSQLALEVSQRAHPTFVWHAERRRLQFEVNESLANQLREECDQVDRCLRVKSPCKSGNRWDPVDVDRDLKCNIPLPRQSLLALSIAVGWIADPNGFTSGWPPPRRIPRRTRDIRHHSPLRMSRSPWKAHCRGSVTRTAVTGADVSSRHPKAFSGKPEVEHAHSQ